MDPGSVADAARTAQATLYRVSGLARDLKNDAFVAASRELVAQTRALDPLVEHATADPIKVAVGRAVRELAAYLKQESSFPEEAVRDAADRLRALRVACGDSGAPPSTAGVTKWGTVRTHAPVAVPDTWDALQSAGLLYDPTGCRTGSLRDPSDDWARESAHAKPHVHAKAGYNRPGMDSSVDRAQLPVYEPLRADPARDRELEAIEAILVGDTSTFAEVQRRTPRAGVNGAVHSPRANATGALHSPRVSATGASHSPRAPNPTAGSPRGSIAAANAVVSPRGSGAAAARQAGPRDKQSPRVDVGVALPQVGTLRKI